jgi:hypothetical protein
VTLQANGPGQTSKSADFTNRSDITSGHAYGLLPWREGASDLQRVIAIRVEGTDLVYEGPFGDARRAHLSRISGPWESHEEAGNQAEHSARALLEADPHHRFFNRVDVFERGYTDFVVLADCNATYAHVLAELIRDVRDGKK